jgi:hypothetical protein
VCVAQTCCVGVAMLGRAASCRTAPSKPGRRGLTERSAPTKGHEGDGGCLVRDERRRKRRKRKKIMFFFSILFHKLPNEKNTKRIQKFFPLFISLQSPSQFRTGSPPFFFYSVLKFQYHTKLKQKKEK